MPNPIIGKILYPKVSCQQEKAAKFLEGKVVLITGASYGIGAALVELLAMFKVHLILIARTEEKLHQLHQFCAAYGVACDIFPCDMYDTAAVQQLATMLDTKYAGINIFISNAGKSIMRSFNDSRERPQDISRTNTLNYLSPIHLIQQLYPKLQANKGCIVNVSALNTLLLPAPKWAAYQASKTAFDQWCRCNMPEWNSDGVQLKTIYLPLVKTRMINPNPHYSNMAAMKPEQAAIRIINLIIGNRNQQKPWWSIVPQSFSFLGRGLWENYFSKYCIK